MDTFKNLITKVPKEVVFVMDTLEKHGFEAYLVGGCVRDLVLDKVPKDWDVATNAKPQEIIGFFEKTVYENEFGTVGVCLPASSEESVPYETPLNNVSPDLPALPNSREQAGTPEYMIVEVTPYRLEAKYSDFRHPDKVSWGTKIEEDLKRRDFTINAMAYNKNGLTDIFGGLKDIKDKTIRAVGEPDDRFTEDALRMLRAVRFATELNFSISHETTESILKNKDLIKKISEERIRDEFEKIIMSDNPSFGIVMLYKLGLLQHTIPELGEGVGVEQLGEHIYDVWEHLLQALQHAANKNWSLEVRLAALFHDIGKPRTRRDVHSALTKNSGAFALGGIKAGDPRRKEFLSARSGITKKAYTFYGHEVVGARMTQKIMERLKFSKKETELVEKLVRNHMFFSDTEKITLSAVRRIITKVGKENIWILMNVRECDRVGMKKKETPYRLRKYFAMIEEALHDPISVSQLKIDGDFMLKNLNIPAGPRMGWILHALLEEILDAPEKNTVEHLSLLVKSLNMLGDAELKVLGERGKEKKEALEGEEIEKLHTKHGVRK